MIKMVPRGISSTADAYLTPVLGAYLNGFYAGFEGGREGGLKVEFMGSDGGLCDLNVSMRLLLHRALDVKADLRLRPCLSSDNRISLGSKVSFPVLLEAL